MRPPHRPLDYPLTLTGGGLGWGSKATTHHTGVVFTQLDGAPLHT
jgi:hypothetical protein